jgi:hypothetical protein
MKTIVDAIPKDLMNEFVGQLMDDLKYIMQSANGSAIKVEYSDLGGMTVMLKKDGEEYLSFRVAP